MHPPWVPISLQIIQSCKCCWSKSLSPLYPWTPEQLQSLCISQQSCPLSQSWWNLGVFSQVDLPIFFRNPLCKIRVEYLVPFFHHEQIEEQMLQFCHLLGYFLVSWICREATIRKGPRRILHLNMLELQYQSSNDYDKSILCATH